jgi:UDP-glucose 4-epimerase
LETAIYSGSTKVTDGVGELIEPKKEVIVSAMKVLVTGASGFLGSWICRLLSEEYEVTGLVREASSLAKISDLKNLKIVRLETSHWSDIVSDLRPEVLILNHWSGVNNQRRNDPLQFENVNGIQLMAEAALSSGVKTIVGVGSQAELGPLVSTISDIELDNPTTVYGQAKVETRLAIEDLMKGTELRFIWMRIFSTYGPLDEGTWLIPNIVDSLVNNREIGLTKGEQQWSYLHAYDLACAFRTVIEKPGLKGIVNVGNPQTISVHKVASIIGEILGKKELLRFGALDYRSDQVMRLEPLCESLTSAGWLPQISFEEGIRQTIDWLQNKPTNSLKTLDGKTLDFKLPSRS